MKNAFVKITVVSVLLLCLLLAACGSPSNTAAPSSAPAAPSTAPSEAPASEPAEPESSPAEQPSADVPQNALIDAQSLKNLIDSADPNLLVIGTLDGAKALLPGNNSGKPIDGSYLVWRPDYTGAGSTEAIGTEVGGYRKSKEDMQTLLSKAGATDDSIIVVYSADNMHDAARLWWQIKLLGHKDVRYLDGGVNAWIAAGNSSGKGTRLDGEAQKTDYVAKAYLTEEMDASIEDVISALQNPGEWVVIDTRTADENAGLKTDSSKGAFGIGSIKGAVHIEWTNAVNPDTKQLKSVDELKAIYGEIEGKKIITYCQSGVRSAHTYLVLKEVLGAQEVYNYDGSWIEWSYAASEASNGVVSDDLKAQVQSLTDNWDDNKKAL